MSEVLVPAPTVERAELTPARGDRARRAGGRREPRSWPSCSPLRRRRRRPRSSPSVGCEAHFVTEYVVFTGGIRPAWRSSAAVGMRRQDYFRQRTRGWLRLNKKGGTAARRAGCHHRAEEALEAYVATVGLEEAKAPLFQSVDRVGAAERTTVPVDKGMENGSTDVSAQPKRPSGTARRPEVLEGDPAAGWRRPELLSGPNCRSHGQMLEVAP